MSAFIKPSLPPGQFVVIPDSFDEAPKESFDDGAIYKFWKVEHFFAGFENVVKHGSAESTTPIFDGLASATSSTESSVKNVKVAASDPLTMQVYLGDGSLLLLELVRFDTVRIRWGPQKRHYTEYSPKLSRFIVMNTLSKLRAQLAQDEQYTLTAVARDMRSNQDGEGARFEWSVRRNNEEHMKILVRTDVFSIEIWRNVFPIRKPNDHGNDESQPHATAPTWSLVWSTTRGDATGTLPLLSRQDAEGNFATCFSFNKRGKFLGFGEQGGVSLLKDRQLLNLFNYDNLAYSSVYGEQALNPAEPLYHSDPFGIEVNGVPGYESAVGVFADDYCQTLYDLGVKHPDIARIGSRFADLEVHITCANDVRQVSQAHSSCVGRPKLFPRWTLGYHQGCYGYDTRDKVLDCAKSYRKHNIPLDGIHIDVDLQQRYRTFTIDQHGPNARFPDPKGMFAELTQLGVKAATNITPIISSQDDNYKHYWEDGNNARATYKTLDSGLKSNVFVKEFRWNQQSNPPTYACWQGGSEQYITPQNALDNLNLAAHEASEYRGAVSYGDNLTAEGVYPDLGRREVRDWWGEQYEELFDAGLSMVWQDMTTPAIRNDKGDMKSFPFRLLLSDDSESSREKRGVMTPALKINNLFSYNLHKATFHGVRKLTARKGLRNFIIGRGSATGQHRFAGLWTGDNTSNFDFLRIYVQQVLSLGIGGTIIAGADVGGFEAFPFTSSWCDPQLLIRWTVANTLMPWFRNHYNGKPGKKLFQEPYAYDENAWRVPQEQALYKAVLPICQYYITLRYTLMQLLYDEMFGNLFDGRPIAQSVLTTDPWDISLLDENASFLGRQYMIGQDVLVAPVVHSEDERRHGSAQLSQVYLPDGSNFYNFNLHQLKDGQGILQPAWKSLDQVRTGGQAFEYVSSIDRFAQGDVGHLPYLLPIFIRRGAVIPTQTAEQYFGQVRPNPLVIHCYPARLDAASPSWRATHDLYLDDGVSLASAPAELPQFKLDPLSGAQSDYRHVRFVQSIHKDERVIEVQLLHDKFDVARTQANIGKRLTLYVWHDANDTQRAASANVSTVQGDANQADGDVQSRYDQAKNATILSIAVDDVKKRTITVKYA